MPVTASDRSAQHNGSAGSDDTAGSDSTAGSNGSADVDQPPQLCVYPGNDSVLADIRADVARWFADHAFSVDAIDRAVLLVSELCSNAVEAGPDHPIEVRLAVEGPGRRAVVAVSNTTLGNVPPPSERWALTDPLAPRGRGLAIVDALSDKVTVDTSVPGRITVVAHISD